jgi:hypothetical protein
MRLVTLAVFVLALANTASGQVSNPPPLLQYAAKFVCGVTPSSPPVSTQVAARGRYFTAINVHNPARAAVATIFKKFTVGLPSETVGTVTQYFEMRLAGDETMQVDCGDIAQHLNQPPTAFLEGYAVIESARELDVVAVYTAGTGTGSDVTSIHTERVPPRRMPPCGNLNLSLNTGTAVWTLVTAPSGPLPRAPFILGGLFALPGSNWISGAQMGLTTGLVNGTVWEYETCFCICPGAQRVSLNLNGVKVDDDSQFFLNGNLLGPISTQTPSLTAINNVNNNATAHFRPGRNCLRVRVVDTWGGFSGLDLVGTINGTGASCQ